MTTDTSEKGLERLICLALTGQPCDPRPVGIAEAPAPYGGLGWIGGQHWQYDREYCIDLHQLHQFLCATQPRLAAALRLEQDSPTRRKFLARLQGEVSKRGTIDVLRKGIAFEAFNHIDLYYAAPSPGNAAAAQRFAANRFSVTRQLRYSRDETQRALDLCFFLNGLPIITAELKNNLTRQTAADAVEQYRRDRNPREKLFEFGRCIVHFALDDNEVQFCTHLQGKGSWFLPFNQGWNDGAGNPPNPHGVKTDYLWQRILAPAGLADIIENYAQLVRPKDEITGKKKKPEQVWPRYHQLDAVRKLLADAANRGVGQRYLIQHSAGSGKSRSIAWLAHQLVTLTPASSAGNGPSNSPAARPLFDSVLVVTDRRILDQQIRSTIRDFAQVSAVFGHADSSADLRRFIAEGKKIIITTVQKFPFILDAIGSEHRGRTFAIIIDEAHSSQGGRTSAAVSSALAALPPGADPDADEEETVEDKINRIIEQKKLVPNASYFAFTATPKAKTLEIFGTRVEPSVDRPSVDSPSVGTHPFIRDPLYPLRERASVDSRPFHVYTMKQAIQERFILDVLASYTPVESYYKLVKTVADDPRFDVARAQKKLRRYVEGHDHAIRLKAEIMADHFHSQVIAPGKIGGQARAMVVTSSIRHAIQYYHALRDYLLERNSPYRAIVAFSGEHEVGGVKVTEATLNGFPSNQIAEQIRQDPYRFLVCADKFQTGYDEPLLHTMYVDKPLAGIKAVQTLSRLNRAHPHKSDVFVLDFFNDVETIRASFADYYRTTILCGETDPNKLHDLQWALDNAQVYTEAQVEQFAELYLGGADRDRLDPILDACVALYKQELDEDGQVEFKGKAKAFLRTYGFLSAILPYRNAAWEKLSIFLNFLVPKLPAPEEADLSKGILEAIDMDSYRVEKQATIRIILEDQDAEIEPAPTAEGGFKAEPELDLLSNILRSFNEQWGGIEWTNADRVGKVIAEELPALVSADPAYANACRNSDAQNARIEHDRALERVITDMLSDHTDLFKHYMDNDSFRRSLNELMFSITYRPPGSSEGQAPRAA